MVDVWRRTTWKNVFMFCFIYVSKWITCVERKQSKSEWISHSHSVRLMSLSGWCCSGFFLKFKCEAVDGCWEMETNWRNFHHRFKRYNANICSHLIIVSNIFLFLLVRRSFVVSAARHTHTHTHHIIHTKYDMQLDGGSLGCTSFIWSMKWWSTCAHSWYNYASDDHRYANYQHFSELHFGFSLWFSSVRRVEWMTCNRSYVVVVMVIISRSQHKLVMKTFFFFICKSSWYNDILSLRRVIRIHFVIHDCRCQCGTTWLQCP